MKSLSLRKETVVFVALMLVLLLTATLSRERGEEARPPFEPSAFNPRPNGLKALYLLYETQRRRVAPLRSSWRSLTSETGLLLAAEPFDKTRPVAPDEMEALKRWVESGGTLLYIATAPTRGYDPKDPLMGDVRITTGDPAPYSAEPAAPAAPILQNVRNIAYTTPVRLKTAENAGYETLLEDDEGGLLITKKVGSGRVLISAVSDLASNAILAQEEYDNLPLLINIANIATQGKQAGVAFDEYHHGVGFLESAGGRDGVWRATPLPIRLVSLHLAMLALLAACNGARRFGKPIATPEPKLRPSTDYATAVAGFWKRAKAGDVAFLILYDDFLNAMARRCAAPDARPETLLPYAKTAPLSVQKELQTLFAEGEAVRAGKRLTESEMLALVQRIESVRRAITLVG